MRRDTQQLRSRHFDIAVVGGGIHGAWVTLRAAQAGLRVALIEKDDFGAATSSNSLNILHGGLRYLQHLDFARMRTSIRARREFCREFPHLARPLQCFMPLQVAGVRSPWTLGPALLLNDMISHDRNEGVAASVRLPRGHLLGGVRSRERLEPLSDAAPFGGAVWWDAVTTDPGRMVLETVIAAAERGAVVANHAEAVDYLVHDRTIEGVAVRDRITDDEFEVRASVVVNASGPWAGELSNRGHRIAGFLPPGWVGGLNVVLRRSLGINTAVALSAASKQADSTAVLHRATRELFFVPWRGVTAVGTDYLTVSSPSEAKDVPAALVERFVEEIARVAPRARVRLDDVAAVQWGLLPQETAGTPLPRKAPILVSGEAEAGFQGLVVIIGEKLTSAPTLSLAVLERARRELGSKRDAVEQQAHSPSMQITVSETRAEALHQLGKMRPDLQMLICAGHETREVAVVHAVREEMAMNLDDIVLRRLGLGYVGHPGHAVLARCAEIAAPELGWTAAERDRAVEQLDARLGRWCQGGPTQGRVVA